MMPEPGFQTPMPYYNYCAEEWITRENSGVIGIWSARTYFCGRGREEVVDLLVDVDGASQVLLAADLSLNEMVAMDGRRDGRCWHASGHEL